MNTQKAAYWLALGLFAFALYSEYQHGAFPALHRALGRAGAVMCRAATHAEQSLATARFLFMGSSLNGSNFTGPHFGNSNRQAPSDHFTALRQAELERMMALREAELNRATALRQANLDRLQRRIDRVQVVMDGAQFEKLRSLERIGVKLSDAGNRHMVLVCPKTGAKTAIDDNDESLELSDADLDVE